MRELTLQSETRRRSRPGLVGRMFSWFRRSRSVEEAPETSPRPEVRDALPEEESPASRTPETPPPSIQPAELEAILDRALDRQARELEAAFERRLEETSRSLSETLTAAVQELGDRLEHQGRKHLGEPRPRVARSTSSASRSRVSSRLSSVTRAPSTSPSASSTTPPAGSRPSAASRCRTSRSRPSGAARPSTRSSEPVRSASPNSAVVTASRWAR